jgi:hypothetical protein
MEPEVHYRVHKIPPLVPTLSQMNPVHTIQSCVFKIILMSFYLRQGLQRFQTECPLPLPATYHGHFTLIVFIT